MALQLPNIGDIVKKGVNTLDQSALGALNPFHFQPQQFLPRLESQIKEDTPQGNTATNYTEKGLTPQQIKDRSINYASKLAGKYNFVGEMSEVPGAEAVVPKTPTKVLAKNAPPTYAPNDYSGVNTWSQYIQDADKGIVENPNFKGSGNPTKYTQKPADYPKTPTDPSFQNTPPSTEAKLNLTKPVIPKQPVLTPKQIKLMNKSGLSNYQLPDKYAENRVPFENQDKSVMANVIGGKTPEDVLSNIPAAKQKIWNNITTKAASVTDVNPHKDVIPYIDNRLNELVKQNVITDTQAKQFSTEAKIAINQRATNGGYGTVGGNDLIDLQKAANGRVPERMPQDTSMFRPFVNKAIADGYRDAIGNINPDIRYDYNQYSSAKRIGQMSSSFRNTAGQDPTFIDRLKQNPALTIAGGAVAAPSIISGVKAVLPTIEKLGGTALGIAKQGVGNLDELFNGKNYAGGKNPNSVSVHNAPIVPQDGQGNYTLPQKPQVDTLTPGTPAFIRANLALPGNSRQFMANAPQYMNTANTVNGDVKAGMPLDIMSKFKSSQDVQAYMSDQSKPYAKQLADVASFNAKFYSAYQNINGTKPDDNMMVSPGDSANQFQQKYDQMVKFIYDNYSQYQIPYLQTTEAPTSTGYKGGTVPYSSNSVQSGSTDIGTSAPIVPLAQPIPVDGQLPTIQ